MSTVEKVASDLNHHQPHPGPDGSWACLGCPVVTPTWAGFADHLAPVALAAEGATARVDREALRAVVSPALQAIEEESARHGVSAGIGMLSDAAVDAALPLLAARGAAAPVVTSEQVERARDEVNAEGSVGYAIGGWPEAFLAVLRVPVTP